MQVEDEGPRLASHDRGQPPARDPVRKQPEIPASGDRQPEAENARRRQRPLDDRLAVRRGHEVRRALGVRDAVAIVAHREDARVVREPGFREDIERPKRAAHDGIARRPIPEHGCPGDVLEQLLRAQCFLPELSRRLLVHQAVRESVAGDFVASRGDLPDQLWVTLGHPSEDEEGAVHPELLEDPEQLVRVGDHPGLARAPGVARDVRRERGNVKVVLHIDGQRVEHRLWSAHSRHTERPAEASALTSNWALTSTKQPPLTILRASFSTPISRNWRWATATTIASATGSSSQETSSSPYSCRASCGSGTGSCTWTRTP